MIHTTFDYIRELKTKITNHTMSRTFRFSHKADCSNMNNFDLVFDTSFITPEQIADFIIEKYENFSQRRKERKGLIF